MTVSMEEEQLAPPGVVEQEEGEEGKEDVHNDTQPLSQDDSFLAPQDPESGEEGEAATDNNAERQSSGDKKSRRSRSRREKSSRHKSRRKHHGSRHSNSKRSSREEVVYDDIYAAREERPSEKARDSQDPDAEDGELLEDGEIASDGEEQPQAFARLSRHSLEEEEEGVCAVFDAIFTSFFF
jgi:hypothetical protein